MTAYFKNISELQHSSEADAIKAVIDYLDWDTERAGNIQTDAVALIKKIRKTRRKSGSLESFFEQYGLNTNEGLALMALAEALLRIPDKKTATALIKDKISNTNWSKSTGGKDKDWLTKVAGVGLKLSSSTMSGLFSKIGEPVIRESMSKTMKVLGKQFVVGETLTGAMKNATKWEDKGYRFSYDMLGEGARTASDAKHYYASYLGALHDLADGLTDAHQEHRPGISVKLSAIYPRYEFAQKDVCLPEMQERLYQLCKVAAEHNLTLTVDAEEVARLDPSLNLVQFIIEKTELHDWQGFGLAVQAYQKSALGILDHVIALADKFHKKIQVRLVKGAYWDTEIKHAQVEGLSEYPVYTRKSNTDVAYLACAQKMLENRDVLYPMFGTHNAYSVAAVLNMAGEDKSGFEFQKLYGMGDALYNALIEASDVCVCVYAPVGAHEELLPYLVRRMLENGANSSFVNQIYDKEFKPEDIAIDPIAKSLANDVKENPKIPLPKNLYGEHRINSSGIDISDPVKFKALNKSILDFGTKHSYRAFSLVGLRRIEGSAVQEKRSPSNHDDVIGSAAEIRIEAVSDCVETAREGFKDWSEFSADKRAKILENFAELLEDNTEELISLCCREGGKTIKDGIDEVREAVDFCRYYAMNGRIQFNEAGKVLPGPTGERNIYKRVGRGVFVCISPWNFPVAIYIGQMVAALMAGNSVIAKPAEQTPILAHYIMNLMHKAGVPKGAVNLLLGDGRIGQALVEHEDIDGVTFTGSTEVAHLIRKTLADKRGPIIPFIAETGGQNAMVVDSSALMEQVVDDVVLSAFGSAGQRCSACRILFIQEDVADKAILMLQGAMQELRLGNSSELSTDIGPVIDESALAMLQKHKNRLQGLGKKISETPLDKSLSGQGNFFAPIAYEITDLSVLDREVFGPVLHVIRYKRDEIDGVIKQINQNGYGLTFGIHSRIDSFVRYVTKRIKAGNIYVNRGTIGAVVGVQPFGGRGLSGTGPKAGGPQYLMAFATEKVISTDTTAAGGNASLVMLDE